MYPPYALNSTVPAALNPTLCTALYEITNPGQFKQWIRVFVQHLHSQHMEHLIPDRHGIVHGQITEAETLGLNWVFSTFIKPAAYEVWVQSAVKAEVSFDQIIIEAISRYATKTNSAKIIRQLQTMIYRGSTPAFAFQAQVRSLLEPLHILDETSNDVADIVKDILLSNLHGPYITIGAKYGKTTKSYTVNDIFRQLMIEYAYNHREGQKPIGQPILKTTVPCIHCKKTNYRSKDCFYRQRETQSPMEPNNRAEALPKSKNTLKPKRSSTRTLTRKNHAANNVTLDEESSDLDDSYYLRHPKNVKNNEGEFLLDTGARTTVVNSLHLLHDPVDPKNVTVLTPDRAAIKIKKRGYIHLKLAGRCHVTLPAFYAPDISYNLLCVHDLERQGVYINSCKDVLEDADGTTVAHIHKSGAHPWLSFRYVEFPIKTTEIIVNALLPKYPLDFVHRLFGHVGVKTINNCSLRML